MAIDDHLINSLERLVDAYGPAEVLSGLGYVFGEKAEHVATIWQDIRLAKDWMKLSADLDKITAKAEELKL